MLSGAQTSTAGPVAFAVAFAAMFATRLWGAKQLLRHQIHWPTAFALRIFRVPVGVACLWWLISRKTLAFEVTPKGASDERIRGRVPHVLAALTAVVLAVMGYAAAGIAGWVPWRTGTDSTIAAGAWLGLAAVVLLFGTARIRSAEYATSRRNAHRIALRTGVAVDGIPGELVDISVGGAAVRFPAGSLPNLGLVEIELPGMRSIKMTMLRMPQPSSEYEVASLQAVGGDWAAIRTISLWLFHTPIGAVPSLPLGVPAIASGR
jgi:cellulose synthase (UDP-forming)